jgi:serine/threonine protein kinase/Tol biopolymer transport system component
MVPSVSLASGTKLGPYEILSPLGAGGMGEVYRGRDTRLGREVAVKVLPAALASDPGRLKRFEREAQSASALNHPSIVTIYDIGVADAISYIAMELVKGEPLRAVLLQGAVPVRRLLQIGTQLAEGLAKAHAAGIVHRDLKPENVMVTEDGHVKILDFGLAKLTQPDASSDEVTLAQAVPGQTDAGVILGTVGYMSPEQAAGASVDYRSDQFSLGSILYEMATGRRAFVRPSQPETLTAIIREEPEPISTATPGIPTLLRWIVERCLAKQPRGRYASTEDLARDLTTLRDRLSEATSGVQIAPSLSEPKRRRRWRISAAIAAALFVSLAVAGWWLKQRDFFWMSPLADARFTRLTDWEGSEFDAAISSDGKFVAFISDWAGRFDAWVIQLGSNEMLNLSKGLIPVPYGNRRRNVGFTADDSHVWIGVFRPGPGTEAWLIPTLGGNPRPFLPGAVSIAWSPDRTRLAYHTTDVAQPIFVADRNGANKNEIFVGEPGMTTTYPVWSPDGRFIYFARGMTSSYDMDIWRIPSGGGRIERVTNHHSRVAYPAFLDEHTLLYVASRPDGSGSRLYAMDIRRRITHAVSFGLEEYLSIAASADGQRLVATVANPTSHLWTAPITDHVVDEGAASRFSLPVVRASAPRFGTGQVFFLSSKGDADGLWSFKDGAATELWPGSEGAVTAAPAISSDATRICVVVRHGERRHLYVMAANGTGSRRVAESLDARGAPSWSPDGRWIAVAAMEGKEQPLFKVPLDGGAPVRLLGGVNMNPIWSPDGKFIVYSEKGEGPRALLRAITPEGQPFPLPEARTFLGGDRYRFLPGGKALVLILANEGRQDFWLLDLTTGGLRRLTDLSQGYAIMSFDVSPDGRQILFDRYRDNSDIVLIDLPPR